MAEGCLGKLQAAEDVEELPVGSLHLLPCTIGHNGAAQVSAYFKPKITGANADGIEVKQAAFRGRRLLGSTLQVPQDYQGFVLEKRPPGIDETDEWIAKSRFGDLTYWNHDTMPTSTDSVRRCVDWLGISAAIHKPVTADEVAAAINEQASGERKSSGC